MTKIVEYKRPPLSDYQLKAFFSPERYSFIEAGTKSGKTYAMMAWLLEQALTGKFINYWWLAPVYPQAEIAYRRLKLAIPERLRTTNESALSIKLRNSHILWFKSGEKPDNLFGDDVGAVAIDEASRFREESYHAARSTLTKTRGPMRIVGNIKGKKNWFYRMAREAEKGFEDARYLSFTSMDAVDAGILDRKEIEDARRVLPESVFNELYMNVATEDGSNPFGMEYIAACIGPLSKKPAVCYGIDLAKSHDFTVVIGIDEDGAVCVFERWNQRPWKETMADIERICGQSFVNIDSTGVGDPIVEELQRRYSGTYNSFKFSNSSKQQIMEGLSVAIQSGKIKYPAGPIVTELEMFEYQATRTAVYYGAPVGTHDDCVCALALAWSAFNSNMGVAPSAAFAFNGKSVILSQEAKKPDWMGG